MTSLTIATALFLLAAEPSPSGAAAPTRVLVLETRADDAYLPRVRAFGDLLATILDQRTAAEIVPSSSVRDRLSVAADKVQAGCDDVACMTEIAGALDARYVIASRASQVGGRWLMRAELFDSQDLKVVAQATTMSDSVEGLAAQAEQLADELLARAPMIPRAHAATTLDLPPPDPQAKGSTTPWVLAGVSGALAVVAAGVGVWSFTDASSKERALDDALAAYARDPSVETRTRLRDVGQAADSASLLHNCALLPVGCLCLPLTGVAISGVWWGVTDTGTEPQ